MNKINNCLSEIEKYFSVLKKSRVIQIKQEEKLRTLIRELKVAAEKEKSHQLGE